MALYSLYFDRDVEKDLKKIPKTVSQRIIKKVSELQKNPHPPQSLKLQGTENTYRIRVGDYRVIYQINDRNHQVVIYHIRHRKEVYR